MLKTTSPKVEALREKHFCLNNGRHYLNGHDCLGGVVEEGLTSDRVTPKTLKMVEIAACLCARDCVLSKMTDPLVSG